MPTTNKTFDTESYEETLIVENLSNWIETALVMSPPILLALAPSCVNENTTVRFAPLAVVE